MYASLLLEDYNSTHPSYKLNFMPLFKNLLLTALIIILTISDTSCERGTVGKFKTSNKINFVDFCINTLHLNTQNVNIQVLIIFPHVTFIISGYLIQRSNKEIFSLMTKKVFNLRFWFSKEVFFRACSIRCSII